MGMHKIQFNFTQRALKDLDELRERIDAPSRAETIRHALRLLQWVADEIAQGHKVYVGKKKGIQEVIFPFMPIAERGRDVLGSDIKESGQDDQHSIPRAKRARLIQDHE